MSGPRVGVVGVGAVGRHHARVVRDLDGVRSAGVFDVDGARAAEVAADLAVPSHASLAALVRDSDAVIVAVPPPAHERVACAAIGGGCHVLIEKPLALDVAGADRILSAAESAGVVLQVGHIERFNPAVVAARPHVDRPLFVEAHRLSTFTGRARDVAVVLDLMIHDVDLVHSLVPQPLRGLAAAGVAILSRNIDVANARLEFEGGAVANLTASRVSDRRERKLRIWQPSGYLSLDLAAGGGSFYRLKDPDGSFGGPSDRETAVPWDDGRGGPADGTGDLSELIDEISIVGGPPEPLAAQLSSFRDAIAGLAEPPVTGEDGRRALEVSLAIEAQIQDHVAHTGPPPPQAGMD